jgi:hypothetical protein
MTTFHLTLRLTAQVSARRIVGRKAHAIAPRARPGKVERAAAARSRLLRFGGAENYIGKISATSTLPPAARMGQFLALATASSTLPASMIE